MNLYKSASRCILEPSVKTLRSPLAEFWKPRHQGEYMDTYI